MKTQLIPLMAALLIALSPALLRASFPASGHPTQQEMQPGKRYKHGEFEYRLLPGWSLDKEHTNDDYLTFKLVREGTLIYYVRLHKTKVWARSNSDLERHIATLTKTQTDNNDIVDYYERPGNYKVLGVPQSTVISHLSTSLNHRGFKLLPVIGDKMYMVSIFDKIEKKKVLRKEVVDFLAGITLAGSEKRDDTPRENTLVTREFPVQGETIPPAKPLPFIEINKVTAAQWDGAVSAAMEGMRLVYGPMNEQQEAAFTEAWAPLRQTPFTEAVDYMNKFNPLLGEFLVYRAAVVQSSQLLEEAVMNAGYAAAFDDPEGVRGYTDLASRYRSLLVSREKRLEQIAKALVDLGNPPDGRALMAQRQGQYKQEKEYLRSLLSTFTPEGCWAGTEDQFMESFGLGQIHHPEYFYVYKVDTSEGEMLWAIDICVDCNVNDRNTGSTLGKANVGYKMKGSFIVNELKSPNYIGVGQGGDNDGKIFHHWVKFDYPAIPAFSETSDSHYLQLIEQGEKKKTTMFNSTFIKQITANRLADAFFRTAVRWTEEGRWDDYSHDPSQSIPEDLLLAFSAEMGGGSTAGSAARGSRATTPPPAAKPVAGNGLHPVEDKSAEERKKLDAEAIQFHTNNMEIINKHMARDREEMAREKDPARRQQYKLRILGAQADLQAERDRIATIQTGQIVHRRSPWDEYAKAGFIQNIAENQQKLENKSRSIRKAYEMAEKLPDDKAREVREVLNNKFKGEMIGSDDEAALQAVLEEANAIGKSYYEAQMAAGREANKEAVEAAEWADACLQTAQVVKTTADYSMMGLSLFGGQYVNNVYQGVTGYIEGGPKEAFLRVAGSYNTATGLAVDGFRGFEEAVNNGGDFMDGIKGAAWEATKGYVTDKALSFGVGKLSSTFARPNGEFPEIDGPNAKRAPHADAPDPLRSKAKPVKNADDFNRPLSAEEMAVYREQVADGRNKVNSYKKTYEKLEEARKAGAPPSEIKKILAELDDRSAKIHSSPQAKMIMKTLQKSPKNLDLIKRYSNSMDRVHQRVEKRYHQEMDQRGWAREELEAIRNRPDPAELQRARERQARGENVNPEDLLGSKTVNMDYDAGRKPRVGPDGKPLPPSRNGEPTSVEAWHAEAQEAWERAFHAETGQSPTHSWENITHSKMGDAYADRTVLERNGIIHANKGWAGQTSDVTYYKAEHMRGSPEFQRVEKYVEIARGTSKDFRTKMNPLFESKKPQAGTKSFEAWQKHKSYWDRVNNVMEQMGSGRKDPLTADREIREITGGKSFLEVTYDMRNFMESLMKL